ELADIEVAVTELWDVAPAAEDRLHVPVLARELDHGIEIGANPAEPLEVLFDEPPSFRVIDTELARQGMGSLPVDRGKVDRLGPGPHLRGDLLHGHPEDNRRGLSMNITTRPKRVHERRIAREMSEQT